MKCVCLVGAESTWKTTIAQALAAHYKTVWVPEYGREYSEKRSTGRGYTWRSEEFTHIAAKQCEMEEAAALRANRVLICDTDAFATAIWHLRYMGERSQEVEAIVASHRRPDLYLVTDVDTPFVEDGTRDGEMIRDWMHNAFIEQLTSEDRPFELLKGSFQERVRQAIEHIDRVIGRPAGQGRSITGF